METLPAEQCLPRSSDLKGRVRASLNPGKTSGSMVSTAGDRGFLALAGRFPKAGAADNGASCLGGEPG